MSEIASASINSFGISAKADFVSPSEEAVFILTASQLKGLVTQAIQPLLDRVGSLEAKIASLDEKIAALATTEEKDVDRICLDIAYDRQRLARLERVEPQPLQRDRGDILRALLAANDGKMLAKDARQKMRMDKATFSRLLATLADYIDVKPLHQDKRRLLLIIK